MNERPHELTTMIADESVPVDRPWVSAGDRWAAWAFVAIILLGGPIQVYFGRPAWAQVLSGVICLDWLYRFGRTAISGRNYFRFPYRRPSVAPDQVIEWQRMLLAERPRS